MATLNTTLFSNQIADLTRSAMPDIRPTDIDGKIRVVVDRYTTTSSLAASEFIALCKIPKGSKVISCEITSNGDAPANAQLGIGTIRWDGTVTVSDLGKYGTNVDLSGLDPVRVQMVIKPETVVDYVTTEESAILLSDGTIGINSGWAFTFIIMYITAN